MDGKSFGARKAAVIRMLHKGYAPEWTQVAVSVADRERLRIFCNQSGSKSMVEGFHRLLDLANVKPVKSHTRQGGSLAGLVSTLKLESDEYDGKKLADRVRDGEFDELIKNY